MVMINPDLFERIEKNRNTIHEAVRATYSTFVKNGQVYFQIDTYGSTVREMRDKVSQSIQLDKQMAAILVDMLRATFHLD
ncbi:MAG: methionyl-tRNA formyltransferase [Bacillota bacterium]|jgi:hypothetical protein